MTKTQVTTHKQKIVFPFFFFLPFDYMRYGLHVVDLAEVYVLYIFVTGALHHLDLEFLSLSLPFPSFFSRSGVRDQVFES